jgi:class 3 adenylate cyclase
MFCGLRGSTGASALLDPEELRELEEEYYGAVAEVITRFGGHVAKYLNDGGWPTSGGVRQRS